MNRRLRSSFPIHDKKLEPQVVIDVQNQLQEMRHRQKSYFDKTTKTAPSINVGDDVRLKIGHRKWTGAKILSNTDNPRSFLVDTDGKVYRRNTSFIRPTKAVIKEPAIITPNVSNGPLQHEQPIPDRVCDEQQSTSSEQQSNSSGVMNPIVGLRENYRARSGREVRPVDRLTY